MPALFSCNPKSKVALFASAVLLILVRMVFAQTGMNNPSEKNAFALRDTTVADEYFERAKSFSKSASFDSSNFYYEQARDIYTKLSEKPIAANVWEKITQCYSNIGSNLWKQGKYAEAKQSLNTALEIGLAKLGEDHLEIARCYTRMGIIHTIEADYENALEFYQKSISISVQSHPEIAANNYNNIGIIYVEKGDYDRALEYYQKTLTIRLPMLGEDNPEVGKLYSNIGNVYWYKGDYDRALEFYKKDLSIQTQAYGTDHPQVATCYHNIGMTHATRGGFDQALEFWRKTLAIRMSVLGEDHPLTASTYFNISLAYMEVQQFKEALENGQRSLAIRSQILGEDSPDVAQSYHLLGNISSKSGDYERALRYLDKALTIRLKTLGNFHPDVALTYCLLGEVHAAQKEFDTALNYCQNSFSSSVAGFSSQSIYSNPPLEEINHKTTLMRSLKLKAKIFKQLANEGKRKNLETALSTYGLAIELLDKMRSGYKAEGSKLFLRETESEIYENAIETALMLFKNSANANYKEQAFAFAEKGKSAVLSAGLAEAEARGFARLPASLLEEEKQLRIDLAFYETQLEKEKFKDSPHDSVRIRKLESRLFDLKSRHEKLIFNFENNYDDYHALKYQTESATIQEIQNYLPENTIVLEYFVGGSSIHIFTILDDEFDVASVPINKSFPSLVDEFYRSLIKAETPKYLATAGKLSAFLIEPILKNIQFAEKLVIIPHDELYKIPFEALFTKSRRKQGRVNYSDLNYVVKRFTISYHYSASLYLNSLKERSEVSLVVKSRSNDFIGFAPVFPKDDETGYTLASRDLQILSPEPDDWMRSVDVDGKRFSELKYSEHEVKSIIELFAQKSGDNKSVGYFYADAGEDAFKKGIKNYRIVHVATHSFMNEEHPQLSGVVFAQPVESNSSEDGVLYTGEVYNLDMSPDLVVLSSCESGVGKLIRGEGMMALTRGFFYSGASNVIYSLWKVPDRHTGDLMIEFYRQMLSGKGYAESLRQAKLTSISNPSTSRPRSWASFILIGTR